MSLMAMVYFIFLSVNSLTYYAMTTLQTFLGVIFRLSTVFELEEYQYNRQIDIPKTEATVQFKNANFTWGFKVKQEKMEEGPRMQIKLDIENVRKLSLENLNVELKPGDFLTVVG